MKHEAMARALTQLDDALIAEAASHAPRKRRYFPHVLAAAACLALVLAAALTMTRSAPPAEIRIGGSALSSAPIPIEQPAPLALSPAGAQPLSISLTIESRAEAPVEVSVTDGVLDSPADSAPRSLSSRAVSGSEALTWTIEAPDTGEIYTLSLDGAPAVTLRYDAANGYWAAAQA